MIRIQIFSSLILFCMIWGPANTQTIDQNKFHGGFSDGFDMVKFIVVDMSIQFDQSKYKGGPYDGVAMSSITDTGFEARLQVKVFLQGPYWRADGDVIMFKTLSGPPCVIPSTSPYADGRTATIAENLKIVDWISLELYQSSDTTSVYACSYFLNCWGQVIDVDGSATLALNGVSIGDYYITIHHRNHLAVMSKDAQSLSGTLTLYDFTTGGLDKYFGGEAALLEAGYYGMYTGDVNQNGEITTEDYTAWYNDARVGASGYQTCDINLDGEVTTEDYTLWYNNARIGASSNVPNP